MFHVLFMNLTVLNEIIKMMDIMLWITLLGLQYLLVFVNLNLKKTPDGHGKGPRTNFKILGSLPKFGMGDATNFKFEAFSARCIIFENTEWVYFPTNFWFWAKLYRSFLEVLWAFFCLVTTILLIFIYLYANLALTYIIPVSYTHLTLPTIYSV